ncbi:MAG: hypothetical protein L6Q97_26815 [Thermoanaerobaculia bacterium]|nr:hypothetical protein [Thermoanaerobaculia bacterium]
MDYQAAGQVKNGRDQQGFQDFTLQVAVEPSVQNDLTDYGQTLFIDVVSAWRFKDMKTV